MMFGGARTGVDRHQLCGPTNGRLLEGNIGGGGSDEGIAGGDDDGNYDSPSDDPGRDSDRFNSGGGSDDPDPVTRRVELTEEQRRAFSGQDSSLVEREVSVGGGTVSVGGGSVTNPGTQLGNAGGQVSLPGPVQSGVDAVGGVIDDVGSTVGQSVDFVTSGPNEPSVGDDNFSDPGVTDGPINDTDGGNTTVDPSQPSTGIDQGLVNETTGSGGVFAENTSDSTAVLPGEVAGVDISEQRLEDLAEAGGGFNERITEGTNATASPQAGVGLNNPVLDDAAGNVVQGAAQLPSQAESAVEFTQNAPLNLNSVQTAGSVATGAAAATARKAVTDPAEFSAELAFGAATGTAGTRAGLRAADPAPVSTRTARFATGDDSVTTARSLELGTESRNIRPVSTVDGRPTTGTPGVDLDEVDLRRQGEAAGPAFEPETRFEADVVEQSLRDRGNTEAADRIDAVTSVVDEADSVGTGTVTRQQVVDAVADVERIDGDPTQIVDELAEQDATVYGSGAVRAQRPDFRAPGDVDAVVPESNIAQADARLGSFGDVDLKTPDRFAGLREGENFGFGTTSRSPIDVEDADGLGLNPIGEEIQRKAGASGFLRRRVDQDGELDVGPRPGFDARNPSGFDFGDRQKDVTDAADLAEVGLGEANPATQQFREAFGVDDGTPTAATPQRGGLGLNIDEFIGGTRAQAGVDLGVGRRLTDGGRRVDVGDSQQLRLDGDTRQQLRAADRDSSPSPSRVRNADSSPSRLPEGVGGSSVFAISPDSSPTIGSSPGSSTPATSSPDSSPPSQSPTGTSTPPSGSPGASSPGGSLFGGSPVFSGPATSPSAGDSPSGSPSPGVSPSPSPSAGDSPSGSPSPGVSPSPSPSPGGSPGESVTTPGSPTSPSTPPTSPAAPIGGTTPTDTATTDDDPRRTNRDIDFEDDGEPSEEGFAIGALDDLFDSGILSGDEALEAFSSDR